MQESSLTNAELAILSLVAEEPRHGYQIEQVIEQRGMRAWTEIGFSSIYFLLNKLEKTGLVTSRLEPAAGRGPARKVFAATPAGYQRLSQGVIEALSVPQPCFPSIQLGLANLPMIKPAEAIRALEQYRTGLDERIAQMIANRNAQRPLPYFVEAMFEYSLALVQAERNWVEKFLDKLQNGNEMNDDQSRSPQNF